MSLCEPVGTIPIGSSAPSLSECSSRALADMFAAVKFDASTLAASAGPGSGSVGASDYAASMTGYAAQLSAGTYGYFNASAVWSQFLQP
eukprot:7381385-Prymnesium_polylepis.1